MLAVIRELAAGGMTMVIATQPATSPTASAFSTRA
jgi:hypothetical protein